MKRSLVFVLILSAALAAGVWVAVTRYAPGGPQSVPGAFWSLSFPDPAGHAQPLSNWRGKVVVLNFWATWCAPCREEIPDFVRLREAHAAHGIEFIGLAVDRAPNVGEFLRKTPVNYPILIGDGAALGVARELGNTSGALPYTVVIGRDGRIALQHLGRLPAETLESVLDDIAQN